MSAKTTALSVVNLALSIAATVLQVWVFVQLYSWHVQLQFNLPELTKWHAFGIMCTIRAFRIGAPSDKERTEEDRFSEIAGRAVFLLILLGLGWVAK